MVCLLSGSLEEDKGGFPEESQSRGWEHLEALRRFIHLPVSKSGVESILPETPAVFLLLS